MSNWPDHFDFEKDQTCQRVFKPFILKQIARLKLLDQQRPSTITYIFHEHAERVARDVRKVCLHLGLGEVVANNMYWAVLPHDIGKTELPVGLWDMKEKPSEDLKRLRRTHTDLGKQIAEHELADVQHDFKSFMLDIMLNHHEQIDGCGYRGLKGWQISISVRLAAIVEAFDGWSVARPHFGKRDVSAEAVLKRMREEKAGMFDPALFEAFAEMKMMEYKKI